MTKVNGKVHVEFWDDSVDQADLSSSAKRFYYFDASTEAELESGLLKIGYVVTNSATYSAVWDLTEHQLDPGVTRHYKVYSSIKNTFQYYENEYLNSAGGINVATNTVYLEYANTGLTEEDEAYKEATAQYTTIFRDFSIIKSVNSIDGEEVDGDTVDVIYRGSVVQYKINISHLGNGEAEDVTAIDYLYNQILLVPLNEGNMKWMADDWNMDATELLEYIAYLEENPDEAASNGFVFVNGELYFAMESLAGTTTYKNVWIDDTHCAAEVINYMASGVTEIIWSYDKQLEGSTNDHLTYYTYAGSVYYGSDWPDTFSASNQVYLNVRHDAAYRSSTLYDEIASIPVKTGTLQKQILVSEKDAEEEVFSDTSQIDLNDNNHYKETVRYKLELDTSVTSDSDIVFSEVIDVLPYTYGMFSWKKYNEEDEDWNVKVESVVYADGSGNPDIDYEIYYSNAEGEAVKTEVVDGVVMIKDTSTPAYQSIRWTENSQNQVTVPKGTGGVWIYVELTFELSADEWEQYAETVSGYLTNTLSAIVGGNTTTDTASVTHTVKTDSEAYLQKGVLAISDMDVTLRYYASIASDTRKVYYNSSDESDCPSVAYYITIYNPSSAYLYLTEIQDLVPEGFTLVGYCGGLDAYAYGDIGSPNSIITTDPTSPAAELNVGDDKVTWMSARVECTLDAETGIVRYTFSQYENLNTTVKYSKEFDCCYLAQYEAISFIVVFDPGTAEETENYATNTIGMPYVDVSGSGVSVGEVEGTAAVATGLEDAEQNVGVCSKYSETEAVEMGFESVARAAELSAADDNEWLVSEVTVHRGEIIPGIKKSVSADAKNGVGEEETVTWTIEITNDGTIPMINYTITDTIDAPYQISGDVYLTIYDAEGHEVAKVLGDNSDDSSVLPFLTITRDGKEFEYTYCRSSLKGLTQLTENGSCGELTTPSSDYTAISCLVSGSWHTVGGSSAIFSFEITKTADGDVFTLNLQDWCFAIPVGGKLELTIDTLPSEPAETGIYYNEATVTPTQAYRDAAVTSGQAVSTEDSETDHQYVSSSDYVVVTGGYSTSSQKWIQSNEDGTKIANSEMDNSNDVRYIVLDAETETFRYTLEASNSRSSPMENLVVVDVLPEVGDYAPFTKQNTATARYSEFQVDLLENEAAIDWEVVIGTKVTGITEVKAASKTITDTKTLKRVELDEDYKTTETSGYVIYYSTTSCSSADSGFANSGMTSNAYADLNATYSDGSRVWTTNPAGARAIRIEILDDIPSNSAVQISFNAKVSSTTGDDNEAEPGEIAWNSFAYRYSTTITSNTGSTTDTLWAAPRKVGVMIPDVPSLKKTLNGLSGNEELKTSDQVFRFLVHEGSKIKDGSVDYTASESELTKALDALGKSYFVVQLTVPAGSTEVEILLDPKSLDADLKEYSSGNGFVYEDGKEYTIVELPNGSTQSGNRNFTCTYISATNEDSVTENVLTFTYSSGKSILVTADNIVSKEKGHYELPITGGSGKELYTLLGLALLCGAGLTFCWRRNRRRVL